MLLIVCLLIWNNVPKWNNVPEWRIPSNGWNWAMEQHLAQKQILYMACCSNYIKVDRMIVFPQYPWANGTTFPLVPPSAKLFRGCSTKSGFPSLFVVPPACFPVPSLSPSCLMEHLLRPTILPPFRVVLRQHKIDENANVNNFFDFSYDNIPVFEEITRVQSCDCTVFFTVSVHVLCWGIWPSFGTGTT